MKKTKLIKVRDLAIEDIPKITFVTEKIIKEIKSYYTESVLWAYSRDRICSLRNAHTNLSRYSGYNKFSYCADSCNKCFYNANNYLNVLKLRKKILCQHQQFNQ